MSKKPSEGYLYFEYEPNWSQKYDYICKRATERDSGKSMVFFLNTIICFLSLLLADIIGRLSLLRLSAISTFCGMLLSYASSSITLKLVGLGVASGSEGVFSALFTIMINESTVPETQMRSTLITGCFMAYGLGSIFINLITLVIRGADLLALFSTALIFFSMVPTALMFVETPKFLFKSGRVVAMVKSLSFIASMNGSGGEGMKESLWRDLVGRIIERQPRRSIRLADEFESSSGGGEEGMRFKEVEGLDIRVEVKPKEKKEGSLFGGFCRLCSTKE